MFKQKFFLTIFGIYQLFSTALIAIGVWPPFVIYLNLTAMLAAVFLFDLEYALYSVILCIPFYLDIPDPKYDTFSTWRIVFLALFLIFAFKFKKLNKDAEMNSDRNSSGLKPSKFMRAILNPGWVFNSWDKYLFGFAIIALLSLSAAKFKFVGLKDLLFVINIYFIYVVAANVVKSKEQILRAMIVVFSSLAAVVLLGFVQLWFSFATPFFYFWQFWAIFIARAYYGSFFANTSLYSNSWISFYPHQPPSLRMFSVLPDSHAFAVLAMFAIPYAVALTYFAKRKWQKILLWIFASISAWAIILSGTRGVWVGLAAPLCLGVYLYAKHYGRKLIVPALVPIFIFIVIFIASPLIQKIISSAKHHNYGNYIQRVESVSNFSDESNGSRLDIWKRTLSFAANHPVFGTGYGNFINSFDKNTDSSYSGAASQRSKEFNLPQKYITAHDLYLQILAETGILGLIFFVLFLKDVSIKLWVFFKKHYLFAEDGYVAYVLGSALYFSALFTYLLVDTTLMNDRVLMYFFLSLALSASAMKVYNSK